MREILKFKVGMNSYSNFSKILRSRSFGKLNYTKVNIKVLEFTKVEIFIVNKCKRFQHE